MQRFLACVVATSALFGCQALQEQELASSAPYEISGSTATAIATDMVTKLAEQVGQQSTIVMKPDSSTFGQALEVSLKSWGYAVVTDQQTEGHKQTKLSYVIDTHEGQILARLSTGAVELGRAYQPTMSGAIATSPLSVMLRG